MSKTKYLDKLIVMSESKKWHTEIDDFINAQNNRCLINGIDFQSKHNHEVYNYGNVKTFGISKNNLYKHASNERGKLIPKHSVVTKGRHDKDATCEKGEFHVDLASRSYLPDILSEKVCKTLEFGKWDDKSINRKNKFFKGVCWRDDQHMKCGQHVENDYVISKDADVSDAKRKEALVKSKA